MKELAIVVAVVAALWLFGEPPAKCEPELPATRFVSSR